MAQSDVGGNITGHQDLAEQRLNLLAQGRDEFGDVGMAGVAVAADGDELDVACASGGDAAVGDQALAVGQQADVKHRARVEGTGTCGVILEARFQGLQVEFVVDQVVEREGKAERTHLCGATVRGVQPR